MSVVDQLKSLFVKKAPESERDSGLSLGMPGATIYPMETDHVVGTTDNEQRSSVAPGQSTGTSGAGMDEEAGNLIALPVLGKKTVIGRAHV